MGRVLALSKVPVMLIVRSPVRASLGLRAVAGRIQYTFRRWWLIGLEAARCPTAQWSGVVRPVVIPRCAPASFVTLAFSPPQAPQASFRGVVGLLSGLVWAPGCLCCEVFLCFDVAHVSRRHVQSSIDTHGQRSPQAARMRAFAV